MTSPNPSSGIFRFLDLSAELRNQIYEEVLGPGLGDSKVQIGPTDPQDYFDPWAPPAILQACRQIREEARAIYYSANMFELPRGSPEWREVGAMWLTSLEPRDVASITKMRTALPSNYLCCSGAADTFFHDFYDEIERAGSVLSDDALVISAQSKVMEGDAICCKNGGCSGHGLYTEHRVNRTQLNAILKMEAEGTYSNPIESAIDEKNRREGRRRYS